MLRDCELVEIMDTYIKKRDASITRIVRVDPKKVGK